MRLSGMFGACFARQHQLPAGLSFAACAVALTEIAFPQNLLAAGRPTRLGNSGLGTSNDVTDAS